MTNFELIMDEVTFKVNEKDIIGWIVIDVKDNNRSLCQTLSKKEAKKYLKLLRKQHEGVHFELCGCFRAEELI